MRLTINLSTRVYIDKKKLRIFSVLIIIAILALLGFEVRSISGKIDEINRFKREIAVLDNKAKESHRTVSESDYKSILARVGFANSIIVKKTYNWLELLDRLELLIPEGTAITSIDPDPKGKSVRLSGVAINFNNLRLFMEHLEESKYFTDVYITGQSNAKLTENMQGLTFTLSCGMTGK
jgi:type IV pilus assembly protein PilN